MHRLIGLGADSREQTGHPRQCCVNPIRHGTLSLTRLILINHKRRIHANGTNFKPQFVLSRNMRRDTDEPQFCHWSIHGRLSPLPCRSDWRNAVSNSASATKPLLNAGFAASFVAG
ncbi:hypothetical protein Agau_C102185 [Agrobacterium tumefaciens F2]|nr:hypothetical protein Agau_C102185 [Agrobacterium tumefaciens F2]